MSHHQNKMSMFNLKNETAIFDGRQLTTNAKWAHNVIYDNLVKT